VPRAMKMPRGVLARRAVATADVTTRQAESQMHPAQPRFQTLFTSASPRGNGFNIENMLTQDEIPHRKIRSVKPRGELAQTTSRMLSGPGQLAILRQRPDVRRMVKLPVEEGRRRGFPDTKRQVDPLNE
jgi:hypothetical protein